jgi:hypothetical protein
MPVRLTTVTLVATCLCVPVTACLAQGRGPSGVQVGDRVRVSTLGVADRRLAEVRALPPDSIELRYDHGFGEARVPLRDVTSLEVSVGRRSVGEGARRGARRGFVSGLVIGGAAAAIALTACHDRECWGIESFTYLVVPAVVVGTTGIGAAIGAAAPGDAWRKVALPGR